MYHMESRDTPDNPHPHQLPDLRVAHVYAVSCLLYTCMFVEKKNKVATSQKLTLGKIIEQTHSHSTFSRDPLCEIYL